MHNWPQTLTESSIKSIAKKNRDIGARAHIVQGMTVEYSGIQEDIDFID